MADARPRRLSTLRTALAEAALDALLVNAMPNVRYLTGFSGSSALVLVTADDVVLITDGRYATQAREEVGDLGRLVIEPQGLWAGLWRALPDANGVRRVGFESVHLVHRDFGRLLERDGGLQWQATTDLVEQMRLCKDEDEVARIAEAAAVATRALDRALAQVRAGMTETQVAGALEWALRDEGSEAFPFPTIVASGPRAALPHARSSSRVLERGDLLLIDFGAVVGGYCADVTRTVAIGRADDEQRAVYAVVRGANEWAASGVRPGMSGRDADALARRYIEERGFADAFGHSLGHGIGLEVHEAPRLASTADALLPAGAVVTIEPGIYRAGWGGVRIEDDVVLTSDGPRVLTSFTRELVELA